MRLPELFYDVAFQMAVSSLAIAAFFTIVIMLWR